MTVVLKGTRVSFLDPDGKEVKLPSAYGLLHDVDGEQFSKCSAFIGPFTRTSKRVPLEGQAKHYLGREYGFVVRTNIPTTGWKLVSRIAKVIRYDRTGKHARPFEHPFRFSPLPLYRSGRFYRLDLGTLCVWDDRGFVFP
jgi:hypothetical protein